MSKGRLQDYPIGTEVLVWGSTPLSHRKGKITTRHTKEGNLTAIGLRMHDTGTIAYFAPESEAHPIAKFPLSVRLYLAIPILMYTLIAISVGLIISTFI